MVNVLILKSNYINPAEVAVVKIPSEVAVYLIDTVT